MQREIPQRGTVVRINRDAPNHKVRKGELGIVLFGYWDGRAEVHFLGKTDPDLTRHQEDSFGGPYRKAQIGITLSGQDFEMVPKEE